MPFHPQGCKTLFRRSWTRHVKSVRKGKYKMTLEELGEKEGKTLQYDKFYKKYYQQHKIENIDELEVE